jgi:hypothetical protein
MRSALLALVIVRIAIDEAVGDDEVDRLGDKWLTGADVLARRGLGDRGVDRLRGVGAAPTGTPTKGRKNLTKKSEHA